MKTTYLVSLILAVIGAINWGLVGLFEFNLVAALFGEMSALSRIVYILVGIAGIVVAATAAPMLRGTSSHAHHGERSPAV